MRVKRLNTTSAYATKLVRRHARCRSAHINSLAATQNANHSMVAVESHSQLVDMRLLPVKMEFTFCAGSPRKSP